LPRKSDLQKRFGANLKAARSRADISQATLAERCDMHRSEISLFERAEREPQLGTIVKLASALQTTPTHLCEGIAWESSRQRFVVE
jgi:transcriptional regulator with XRE-family HTH domain